MRSITAFREAVPSMPHKCNCVKIAKTEISLNTDNHVSGCQRSLMKT